MPQIILKGIASHEAEKLAGPIIDTVSQTVECPKDWVTVELCESKFFNAQGLTAQYPILQVWWYERPLEIQNLLAEKLSNIFLKEGYPLVQLSFHLFQEKDYYEFEA